MRRIIRIVILRQVQLECSSQRVKTGRKRSMDDIPEDGIIHSHRRENLKSYIASTGWALKRRRNVSPVRY
jgi:hypothetical protein